METQIHKKYDGFQRFIFTIIWLTYGFKIASQLLIFISIYKHGIKRHIYGISNIIMMMCSSPKLICFVHFILYYSFSELFDNLSELIKSLCLRFVDEYDYEFFVQNMYILGYFIIYMFGSVEHMILSMSVILYNNNQSKYGICYEFIIYDKIKSCIKNTCAKYLCNVYKNIYYQKMINTCMPKINYIDDLMNTIILSIDELISNCIVKPLLCCIKKIFDYAFKNA
jgi:hypothetical protein